MRLGLSSVALLAILTALSAGDHWPQFRGPNGDGVSDAKSVPTKWSETENIRWKTEIHDKGWSSPVVWGEQVWVTTAKEKGGDYWAVGLDRKTGKVIHDLHLFTEPPPTDISQYNSYASPTPALEEGRLYAHFGSHGTACIDTATGKKLWERRDLPCNHFRGPASSPVVWRDKLFLLFDGFDVQYLACLDKNTGKTVWKKDRALPYRETGRPMVDNDYKKAYATPSVFEVNGRPQLVAPAAMGTIAYDPATGEEIWRVIHDGMNEACRPILAHGLIYLTAGSKASLWAVKAGGTGDLTPSGVAWKKEKAMPTKPSPVVVGDALYLVNDSGIAYCLDAKTGAEVWRETLGGKFAASPVYAAGNIYFSNEDGKTFVVAASRSYTPVEVNRLDAGCMASPAVAGDAIFLRTKTHLYCIGTK
jgi:outer membrane protein assembly factor BamB